MKVIDINYIIYSMMNNINGKPKIKIKVLLYSEDFYNIDRFVNRIRDKMKYRERNR